MKKWYGLIVIIALTVLISAIGLIFGQAPTTIGTLREKFIGKHKRELITQIGAPEWEIKQPHKPGKTLAYGGNLIAKSHGTHPRYILFDLNAEEQVSDIYVNPLLVP